jgi:hypothetical protein
MEKPLAIDLYCGLGGWAEGFLAEGYCVLGFDIERHDYGTGGYPGDLVLRDVRSIHGAELIAEYGIPAVIVGSSPCQEFSYRAMPWKRAKALPPPYLGMELFQAQFRIQREASEAAGRYIPLIVENVRGAQKWLGRARWNHGSYYLWGDVPALMPFSFRIQKFNPDGTEHPPGSWFKIADSKRRGRNFHAYDRGLSSPSFNGAEHETRHVTEAIKQHGSGPVWLDTGIATHSSRSRSRSRKEASALIAKIPFPLAQHIARCFKPAIYEVPTTVVVNPHSREETTA